MPASQIPVGFARTRYHGWGGVGWEARCVTTVTPQVLLLFKEDQLVNLDALVAAPQAGLGDHPFSVVLSSSHRSAPPILMGWGAPAPYGVGITAWLPPCRAAGRNEIIALTSLPAPGCAQRCTTSSETCPRAEIESRWPRKRFP